MRKLHQLSANCRLTVDEELNAALPLCALPTALPTARLALSGHVADPLWRQDDVTEEIERIYLVRESAAESEIEGYRLRS